MLEKANTSKNVDYLSDNEKSILFYCNLVRIAPSLFADTYAKRYIDSININSTYTKSLIKTLHNTGNLEVLNPSIKLSAIAKTHAIDFGNKGKLGHGDFKKRFEKYIKECNCEIGENCDYGHDKPLDIVMSLLIDEKISNLSHRKNILNPQFKNGGISISKHKKFDWNCVMDFSSNIKAD
jgi:uncharacterized protein YkwD